MTSDKPKLLDQVRGLCERRITAGAPKRVIADGRKATVELTRVTIQVVRILSKPRGRASGGGMRCSFLMVPGISFLRGAHFSTVSGHFPGKAGYFVTKTGHFAS